MAAKPKSDIQKNKNAIVEVISDPRTARKMSGANQQTFWNSFGVTQSGGSRYEAGRTMDGPLRMLMALHVMGRVTDDELAELRALVGPIEQVGVREVA